MTDSRYRELAKRIKAVNRSEVHRTTGLSLSGVSRILSGGRVPKSTNLREVALAINVSMDELFDYIITLRKRTAKRKSQSAAA